MPKKKALDTAKLIKMIEDENVGLLMQPSIWEIQVALSSTLRTEV